MIYDRRGTGLSERNISEMTHSLLQFDLEAVVDAAGLDRFPLYAHSFAGPTAIDYVTAHPEKVSRITFFATSAKTGGREEPNEEWEKLFDMDRRLATRVFV